MTNFFVVPNLLSTLWKERDGHYYCIKRRGRWKLYRILSSERQRLQQQCGGNRNRVRADIHGFRWIRPCRETNLKKTMPKNYSHGWPEFVAREEVFLGRDRVSCQMTR
ncbi:hypothetical protein CEXT_487051 [Caerostris extrusa]|uniref:Uncharacterized protein n=1 Tax=Caerostris extrusa TaxID=172846 RepID=A0AAV4U5S3_CAEEX|nr:hypothetical protein CEXT_487051 [Caerostris extrusa]